MMSHVSIIMPVHNAEEFLPQALESVLRQTHRDFELIVLDDGSTDRSANITANFAAKDQRIRLLRKKNKGLATALADCLHEATNELVVRMDADDVMCPNRLERQIWYMEQNPQLSVTTSYAWLINRWDEVIGQAKPIVDVARGMRERKPEYFVDLIHPAIIMRKSHVDAVGGYSLDYRFGEDRELWGRLALSGYQLGVQPEFLIKQRLHSRSMTAQHFHGNVIAGRFIDHNIVRLLRAEPCLSFEQFLSSERHRSFSRRFAQAVDDWAKVYYRAATRDFAERLWWPFFKHGVAAICLRPTAALRMWQKLASQHPPKAAA